MDNPLQARSPTSSQLDDEAPRPLPSLPTEIKQRIIQLALPRLAFETFRERYKVLLTCCRVNKLWAALAQKELVKHVGFATIKEFRAVPARTSYRYSTTHQSFAAARNHRLAFASGDRERLVGAEGFVLHLV
ncbi:hypothetical protein BCR35DRAFT_4898 [Leucosporidium creatinivorum]|uniref:F-box domain-containing protein n=1 Tax=Leucosporidium creatinivorum TaxID=106004 RepID=A0A1Y2G3X4_9BASI|nr:hypothetical protein BCR35DRAFT_4898 [Leucosporidium creatinivorum]